jgi:DNA-binding response OmpR family regulator
MNTVLAVGALRLLRDRYELQWGAQVSALNLQDSALLTCFLGFPGELVPTHALQAALWPDKPSPQSNALHVLVSRLRRKLAQLEYPGAITPVHRQGYRFVPAPDAPGSAAPRPAQPRRLPGPCSLGGGP